MTSVTKPPTTLPDTGVPFEQVRGFGVTGGVLLIGGIVMLAMAALVGNRRVAVAGAGAAHEIWVPVRPGRSSTIYLPLHRTIGTD